MCALRVTVAWLEEVALAWTVQVWMCSEICQPAVVNAELTRLQLDVGQEVVKCCVAHLHKVQTDSFPVYVTQAWQGMVQQKGGLR